MITFRLTDALPAGRLEELDSQFGDSRNPKWRKGLEESMDSGYGECWLRDPLIAKIVEDAFLYFDGKRYRLIAWVVMPNHVHVVIEVLPGFALSQILHSWKGFTAKEINRYLGREGRLWQTESFDRMVRDERHLMSAIEYIHANPVKAGLVREPLGWPFSSARRAGETPALPAFASSPTGADQ